MIKLIKFFSLYFKNTIFIYPNKSLNTIATALKNIRGTAIKLAILNLKINVNQKNLLFMTVLIERMRLRT